MSDDAIGIAILWLVSLFLVGGLVFEFTYAAGYARQIRSEAKLHKIIEELTKERG